MLDFAQHFFHKAKHIIATIEIVPIIAAGNENSQWTEVKGLLSSSVF
jgi:hypothetical protein